MSAYHIQPMTGRVHTDPKCSVGTARYGTVPAEGTDEAIEEHVRSGRLTACAKCGPQPPRDSQG